MIGNDFTALRQRAILKPLVRRSKRNRALSSTWIDELQYEGVSYPHVWWEEVAQNADTTPLVGRSKRNRALSSTWINELQDEGLSYLHVWNWGSSDKSFSFYVRAASEEANTSTLVLASATATYPPQLAETLLAQRLQAMKREYPDMSVQFDDAISFARLFDDGLVQPAIWTDNEAEVVLEWLLPRCQHAIVSFEGDGEFGYAFRIGDKFIPGSISGSKPFCLPSDLVQYISAT